MLPFPTFSVVGVRSSGEKRVLATDLTPYRQAEQARKLMLDSPDCFDYPTMIVKPESSGRDFAPLPFRE